MVVEAIAMERLGMIGLGKMGAAMAERLLKSGCRLTVWNRTAARAEPLKALSATVANGAAELVAASDIVITCVTDEAALQSVFAMLANADLKGRLFMDISTVTPTTSKAIAANVVARGGRMIDAPMSGTIAPAREGALLGLIGGDASDVARAQPVLSLLCRKFVHLGPLGSGATMKLVMNLPLSIYWASMAEALSIGKAAGLELPVMVDLIADSKAALAALPPKVPVLLGKDVPVNFDIAGMLKDVTIIAEAASALSIPSPVTQAAVAKFAEAVRSGWGEKDCASIVRFSMSRVPDKS